MRMGARTHCSKRINLGFCPEYTSAVNFFTMTEGAPKIKADADVRAHVHQALCFSDAC